MPKQSARQIFFTISLLVGLTQLSYAQPITSETASPPSSPQTIYKQVNGSVFTLFGVETEGDEGVALGSAVAIGENLLATNCHVAFAGNMLLVRINNQNKLASVV